MAPVARAFRHHISNRLPAAARSRRRGVPALLVPWPPVSADDHDRWTDFPWTVALVALCVVAFVGQVVWASARSAQPLEPVLTSLWTFEDLEVLRWSGALFADRVWLDGEWWRVVSAGFLHGSWLHLALNGVGLWAVGSWLERAIGGGRMAALFLGSSVLGCLTSLAWAEAPVVVGASAGIFGLAGALVVSRWFGDARARHDLDEVPAGRLSFWLAVWLAVGWLAPGLGGERAIIAQAGHVGGLLGGLLLGVAWRSGERTGWVSKMIGGAGFVLVGGAMAWAAAAPTWWGRYHELVGYACLDREELDCAREGFERALASEPDDPGLQNAVAYAMAEAGVELGRAEDLARSALASSPENRDYLDTLGWTLCRQGRVQEGLEVLRRAAEVGGSFEELESHVERCESADAVQPGA